MERKCKLKLTLNPYEKETLKKLANHLEISQSQLVTTWVQDIITMLMEEEDIQEEMR